MSPAPGARWLLCAYTAVALVACVSPELVGSDCVADSGVCKSPLARGGGGHIGARSPDGPEEVDAGVLTRHGRIANVDLLLVLDRSASMAQERAAFAEQLGPLLVALMRGELDGNGEEEFLPVADLHVAVVSSDLGAGSRSGNCDSAGDSGAMWLAPGGGGATQGCADAPEGFLAARDAAQAQGVADALGCVLRAPADGCRLEQPLAAALAALAREKEMLNQQGFAPMRVDGSATVTFLRPDSLVVILVLADEDDCSSTSPGRLLTGDTSSTACASRAEFLDSTATLSASLREVRDDAHDLILLAAVTGVPMDRVDIPARLAHDMETSAGRAAYYEALLADPRMATRSADGSEPEVDGDRVGLSPACSQGTLRGYPALRLVNAVSRFGAQGVVQSVCDPNGWQLVAYTIGRRLGSPER